MPRHDYELTRQTLKVVNGHAQELADHLHVTDKHVYAILAGTYTDPFAIFDHWYSGCVRAGLDVSHYDNRLAQHRERAQTRSGELNINLEVAKATKEASDVPIARLNEKPLYDQLNETCQAISQLENVKRAILHAINADKDRPRVASRRFV